MSKGTIVKTATDTALYVNMDTWVFTLRSPICDVLPWNSMQRIELCMPIKKVIVNIFAARFGDS
jgi:hypothetical protein